MPRSHRPRRGGRPVRRVARDEGTWDPDRVLSGLDRIEELPDGAWVVRRLAGASSTKTYRCPGCDQEILPGTPHVVVWGADGAIAGFGDVSDRRHWHTPCWTARARRGRGRGR